MTTAVVKKPLTTERQKELMRVINECFGEFAKRQQHYYGLDGMSTHHVTLHAIQDFTTLRAFWPSDLVERNTRTGQTVYLLEEKTMSKVQSAVRDALVQLQEKGWVERLGNEHERRWRPIRDKPKRVTKEARDPSGQKIGYYEQIDDGPWTLHLH